MLVFLLIITAEDVCLWPYPVDVLVKLVTFLGSLHWPSAGADLGPGGTSYVELLILGELLAGERFQFEKAVLGVRGLIVPFQCRLFLLVQALMFGDLVISFLALCFVRYVFALCYWCQSQQVTMVGINLVMVSPPGLVRLLMSIKFLELLFLFGYLLDRGLYCCAVICDSVLHGKVPAWSRPGCFACRIGSR